MLVIPILLQKGVPKVYTWVKKSLSPPVFISYRAFDSPFKMFPPHFILCWNTYLSSVQVFFDALYKYLSKHIVTHMLTSSSVHTGTVMENNNAWEQQFDHLFWPTHISSASLLLHNHKSGDLSQPCVLNYSSLQLYSDISH